MTGSLGGVMSRYRWFQMVCLFCLSLGSLPSMAHVRWFAPEGLEPVALPNDSVALGLAAVVLGLVLCALTLQLLTTHSSVLAMLLEGKPGFPYRWLWLVMLSLISAFMVVNLLLGEFLAPNLILPQQYVWFGIAAQAAVLVLMPWSISLVGIVLLVVFSSLFGLFPAAIAADYWFLFTGLGLALLLVGPSFNRNDKTVANLLGLDREVMYHWAAIVLRIALGAQLLELAIHNKIMTPEAALWFIEHNPVYNFFPLLGFTEVSHLHFVWFVGLSETGLGLMLIFSIANRAALLMLAAAFTATAVISGITEVAGHLPIFGVLFVLIAEAPNAAQRTYHPVVPAHRNYSGPDYRGELVPSQ